MKTTEKGLSSMLKSLLAGACLILCAPALAQDAEWTPISGADVLRDFMSGLTAEREVRGGEISRGEYSADGTGVLHAWGASVPRTWTIEGEDRLCITAQGKTLCYQLEKHADDEGRYRIRAVATVGWSSSGSSTIADAFGPEWMFSFSVAPVVKNKLADWFGLGED